MRLPPLLYRLPEWVICRPTKWGSIISKRYEGAYAALTVFLVLITLTAYQAYSVSRNAVERVDQHFEFRTSEITSAIKQRLKAYESALQGGAGLFAATQVERGDWERYVRKLDLNRNYPGIQGVGFARALAPDQLEAFEQQVRGEGFPDFEVWPAGNRPVYTSILYLEPFDWRNRRAFGYDMFTEPRRREAMTRARDTGQAIATEALSLVQETEENVQTGFLIYLPVYRGPSPTSVAERRERLFGYVYSPFRMRDLMQGIFGSSPLVDVRLKIAEPRDGEEGETIFDSQASSDSDGEAPAFQDTVPLEFNGHQWNLNFESLPPLEAMTADGQGRLVLVGGTVISLLLSAFVWALWQIRSRRWALNQANVSLMEEVAQREHVELRLNRFFSLSADLLCTLHPDGRLRQVNPAWNKLLGFDSEDFPEKPFIEFVHEEDRARVESELKLLAENKIRCSTMDIRNLTESGGVRWVEWNLVTADEESALYGNGRDVTERKHMEQELHRNAFYDRLTGVANRSLFMERLKHVIDRSHRYGETYAALIMDMDNFKTVNDSYGHLVGDRLLAAFAQRVQQQLRPVDTCARFGGDEFIILLEEAASREDVSYIAERIQSALNRPFGFDGDEIRMGSSMGIALGDSRYQTTHEVLRDADMALYEAKRLGKNRYVFFDARMRTEQLTHAAVEAELRHALDRQELEVVYQPIVDLQENRTVGCEALIRWAHSRLGEMSPAEFIPIAEKSGMISAIGRFVSEQACEQLGRWLGQSGVDQASFVSVNLSPREFFVGDLVARIRELLNRNGLQGRHLRLEVTEGVLIERYQEAATIFRELQAMGVQICIDDFGTGYSSLSYLQSLPINVLKLDRSLIQRIQESAKSREIARTVLNLATALEVQSVAEGVETEAQLVAVREVGFRYAQGFGLCRPVDGLEMQTLLAQDHPETVL